MAMNATYSGPLDLPSDVPVFPLPGALLLPRSEMPLNIFEPRYLEMIDDALAGDRLIGIVQPVPEDEDADRPALWKVGCVGRITAFQEVGDGRVIITLTGICRFNIVEETAVDLPYRVCRIDTSAYRGDFLPPPGNDGVDRPRLIETLEALPRRQRPRRRLGGYRPDAQRAARQPAVDDEPLRPRARNRRCWRRGT